MFLKSFKQLQDFQRNFSCTCPSDKGRQHRLISVSAAGLKSGNRPEWTDCCWCLSHKSQWAPRHRSEAEHWYCTFCPASCLIGNTFQGCLNSSLIQKHSGCLLFCDEKLQECFCKALSHVNSTCQPGNTFITSYNHESDQTIIICSTLNAFIVSPSSEKWGCRKQCSC